MTEPTTEFAIPCFYGVSVLEFNQAAGKAAR
jgi:hypothetical protein